MRRVYVVMSGLLLLAVLVQFYLAAVGAFAKPQVDGSFALHDINGTLVIPVLCLVATVAAALARAPRGLIGLTILPLGLVLVQMLLVVAGTALDGGDQAKTTPAGLALLGLHALNGLAIIAVVALVFRRARTLAATPSDAVSPQREVAR